MAERKGKKVVAKHVMGMGDTGSVVNTVKGHVSFGRLRVSGNDPKRNQMVSGNSGMKRRG